MKYNHNRKLKSFKPEIEKIWNAGYFPIAVTQMYFEDVFVFETAAEALTAYYLLEKENKEVVGYWYGKDDFLKAVETYETENNGFSKVKIFWLK